MNDQEKIDLINTLTVISSDADGEFCNYVNVALNDETRAVLNKLRIDENDRHSSIDEDGKEYIDIAPIAFKFAKWWYEDKGFSEEVPDEQKEVPDEQNM